MAAGVEEAKLRIQAERSFGFDRNEANCGRPAISNISLYLTCYSPRKGACWIIAGKSNNRHRWLRA